MRRLPDEVRKRLESARYEPRSRRSLLDLGLSSADLRRLLHQEVLQRHHGLYVGSHLDATVAAIACAQAVHPGSVVSHFTAAALAELRTWVDTNRPDRAPSDAIWLTRQPARVRAATGDIVVRRAVVDAADVRRHNRLLITREARTVADLARELPLREALVTLDHALAVAVTRADLGAALDRQAGWPGIRQARRAVELADPRSESALESIARATFASYGLPPPVPQASFWSGGRWMRERVDFWWPQYRTVAEADGLAKYEAATAADRRRLMRASFLREQRIADVGVELVRFGWEDTVDSAGDLIARLHDAFTRGAARPGDPPRWRTDDPLDLTLWPRTPPPDEAAVR